MTPDPIYANLTQALADVHQSLAASGRLSKVERAQHAVRAARLQSEAAHLRRALRAPKRQARAARAADLRRARWGDA